jgi:hypothetical protein
MIAPHYNTSEQWAVNSGQAGNISGNRHKFNQHGSLHTAHCAL